jgi:hypothetical protein
MSEDVARRMTEDELRQALADIRAVAQADDEWPRTNVQRVDISAEDIEAIREAYHRLARLWQVYASWGELDEFGSPEMLRNLPIHRLYAIDERWQTLAADRPPAPGELPRRPGSALDGA